MNKLNLDNIIDLTVKNNGGTFNLHNIDISTTTGYVVAIKGFEKIVAIDNFNKSAISEYIEENLPVFLQYPEAHLGTWVHEGNVYLDISKVYQNENIAISIAKQQGEIAIFNLEKLESVYL